jgi:hypothetical protein
MSAVVSLTEAEKRFDWINGFLTASVHAVLESISIQINSSTRFEDVNRIYTQVFRSKLSSVSSLPQVYLKASELDYLFHLESEMWGTDFNRYTSFFETRSVHAKLLQTFLLPHSFFLFERWLYSFIPHNRRVSRGRPSIRRDLFGKNAGIFTSNEECLASFGPPYNLLATSSTVMPAGCQGNPTNDWSQLAHAHVPGPISLFYRSVCRLPHFVPIIDGSFKNSRIKLPKHLVRNKRDRRRESRGLRSTWYDVLWLYSESVRYHLIRPSATSLARPFYWNRSVRWYSSIIISGLMCLIDRCDPTLNVSNSWQMFLNRNRILDGVFGTSR